MPATDSQRLFFALWPDESLRQAMVEAGRAVVTACGGRPSPVANLHVTLAFLGSVPNQRLSCLQNLAQRINVSSFELCLDSLGCWPSSSILWLACSVVPAGLLDLAETLQEGLPDCGIAREKRRFKPHVTLARQCRRRIQQCSAGEDVVWPVKDFVLIVSTPGRPASSYRVLARWPLAG